MEEHAAKEAAAKQEQEGQLARKALADMDLLDDFLFGSMVTYPEIGERFVRILLKTIFGKEFKHLSVTAQKVFYGTDTNWHGARLDVYLEPDEAGDGRAAVYDIEPDRNDKEAETKALPRRVRFYHGKIAARNLNSGADYGTLKNVVIIMIMPYDPFGLDRMVYTVKNKCVEVPEMAYEDGASTLFLYTKGTVGVPSEAVRQLLHYMEDTTYGNAVNEDLREIHRMVETVKRDPEVVGMTIKVVEDLVRLSEKVAKLTEEKARAEEERVRAEEERVRAEEERVRAEEERSRAEEEKASLAEKVKKLEEELAKRS